MKREVKDTVTGSPAVDGAGVHLVRVLGPETVERFDPFLMLDAFDSRNPSDYIKGFPLHPHRGIETFTYLMKGRIEHQDSLGNRGTIHDGESQWMTGGSGIMHQEMPQPSEHLLGLQLWINLPRQEKMTTPKYFDINADMIREFEEKGATIRVVAGQYKGHRGAQGHHLPVTFLDVNMEPGESFSLESDPEETLFVYLVEGSGRFGSGTEFIPRKTAVLFGEGDTFEVEAGPEGVRFVLASAPPLREPVVWGGPIVMNTRQELEQAFGELNNGTFIKEKSSN